MDCSHFIKHMHPWMDGELLPSQARLFKEHARSCPQCQQQIQDLQSLYNAMAALPAPPPPSGLKASTLLVAKENSTQAPVSQWWLSLPALNKGLGVTALAAGLLLGVFLYTATFYSTAMASSTTSPLSLFIDEQGDDL